MDYDFGVRRSRGVATQFQGPWKSFPRPLVFERGESQGIGACGGAQVARGGFFFFPTFPRGGSKMSGNPGHRGYWCWDWGPRAICPRGQSGQGEEMDRTKEGIQVFGVGEMWWQRP